MTQFPVPPALVDDLRQVEQRIQERIHARGAVITAVGPRLWPGGERVRAALVLAAALTGEYRPERVLHAAAAVELIYAATATHGNLVDEGARRRGAPRAGEWGQGLPLMVGDYLFALAAGEMALTPDARVIDFYSQAVMQVTEAALAPPPPLLPLEPARERHIERRGGAAAIVAAACKAGGACAGAPPEQIEALGAFGHTLGLALALAEEVQALLPTADLAPAEVLRDGAVSLPLIYAAHLGDGERLAAALDSGNADELGWAADEVARHGLGPARAEVARLAAGAGAALEQLAPGAGRDALAAAAGYPPLLAAGA